MPKFTAAGLALSAFEDTEFDVAALEFAADDVETPFALVTPVQPERITPHVKSVKVRKTTNPGRLGQLWESVARAVLGCMNITLRVYGVHTFHLYWSDESMRYRCSGVFERTLWGLAYGERTVSI